MLTLLVHGSHKKRPAIMDLIDRKRAERCTKVRSPSETHPISGSCARERGLD